MSSADQEPAVLPCPRCGNVLTLIPFTQYNLSGLGYGVECSHMHGGCGLSFHFQVTPEPGEWRALWNAFVKELNP